MDQVSNLLVQTNLNHCAAAQDLFLQTMAQWSIGVAVVAEPYSVPPRPNWMGDWDGSVAVVGSTTAHSPPLSLRDKGTGYVAVEWGGITIYGVYFSPNRSLNDFEVFLISLETSIRRLASGHVLVLGDFNAKSIAWGSPRTDARGEAVEEWAASVGLCLLNRGSTNTCVRQQGGSIVDLSFATPALAARVRNWRVLKEVETLSDHLYIRFELSRTQDSSRGHVARRLSRFPRWAVARLNRDLLEEAAIIHSWLSPQAPTEEVDVGAGRFRDAITHICDAAMPRIRGRRPPRKEVYWWSQELADLRAACTRARRSYTRSRRRHRGDGEEDRLHEEYRRARKTLKLAISRAKEEKRQEMLEGLNRDPWGRPYRAVRQKLHASAPPLTETLQPSFLREVVEGLFPQRAEHTPPSMASLAGDDGEHGEDNVPPVRDSEVGAAVLRIRSKNTAPGPDGVPARVLALALNHMADRLGEVFDASLASGRFPECWKSGKLVLLRKPGRPADSVAAYRPIVLLDEAGKLFERVLSARIVRHLCEVGPDLSDAQFGFRAGRSTVDAVLRLRAVTEEAVSCGGVLLAVSLDIANVVNSLPFSCIREALHYHGVPKYLRRLVADYLEERTVVYEDREGNLRCRPMSCGVPQGSVLGPLLWNIGYDWALRADFPPGLGVICYADDTLVTARGANFQEAARLATGGVSLVVGRIEALGLRVALDKTEALLFHGPRRGPPLGASIVVNSVLVPVRAQMKYLGLILDGRWLFDEHFRQLAPKLVGAASALGRLLPNMGGPSVATRRLYTGVVRSMALYGAPVWAAALTAQNRVRLWRPQRVMAVRAIRGYRTVSTEVACALAGTPPWDLEAEVLAEVYRRVADRAESGFRPPPEDVREWREAARRATMARWSFRLETPRAGFAAVEALQPVIAEWAGRQHGTLSFRLTQVLSGTVASESTCTRSLGGN
ncbi:unnamed protein product [Arctia plantaginis]|uniref:Reverse transcriptase domain-containing protein n=1 Tax=Arctia plantaginis TaxID=874455 RepID=A0A8S1BCC0_ARCPL|nr:unnamed protein product [Arctia plantaginis]